MNKDRKSLERAVDALNSELAKWNQPPTVTVGIDKESGIPRVFASRFIPPEPETDGPF
jgi:hypothetical protein